MASLLVDDPVDFHPRAYTRAHARCTALLLYRRHCTYMYIYIYTRFIGPDRSLELLKQAGEREEHAHCFTTIFLSFLLLQLFFFSVFWFVVSGVHGAAYIRNTLRETERNT